MDSLTKIKYAWWSYDEGISVKKISAVLKVHRATIYRWISGIKKKGYHLFLRQYESAKKGRRIRKVDGNIYWLICHLRKKYRRSCGQKIQYLLNRRYGLKIGLTTIYKWLHRAKVVKKQRQYKGELKGVIRGKAPLESIQVDRVD